MRETVQTLPGRGCPAEAFAACFGAGLPVPADLADAAAAAVAGPLHRLSAAARVELAAEQDERGVWCWLPVERFIDETQPPVPLALRCCPGARLENGALDDIADIGSLLTLDLSGALAPGQSHQGLGSLARLGQLRRLTFAAERSGGDAWLEDADLAGVGGIASLRHLHLRQCWAISDAGLQHLAKLEVLRVLDLSGCRHVTGGGLVGLPALRCLALAGCAVEDDALAAVAGLTGLEQLELDRNRRLRGWGLAHLGRLSSLERLSLNRCRAVDEDHLALLGRLRALRELDVTGLALSDAGLALLCGLAQLTTLTRLSASVGGGSRRIARPWDVSVDAVRVLPLTNSTETFHGRDRQARTVDSDAESRV